MYHRMCGIIHSAPQLVASFIRVAVLLSLSGLLNFACSIHAIYTDLVVNTALVDILFLRHASTFVAAAATYGALTYKDQYVIVLCTTVGPNLRLLRIIYAKQKVHFCFIFHPFLFICHRLAH
jgi:hypothetical protein